MNKLQGFLELRETGLPSVPWKRFVAGTVLDRGCLWTVRCAVLRGDDLNLPRKVGAPAEEAEAFAEGLLKNLGDGFVLYYPFFVAEKSGVLEVSDRRVVIEAVCGDLWNLVTCGRKDVTFVFEDGKEQCQGRADFLLESEIVELLGYSAIVRRKCREIVYSGQAVLLEWSYAFASDLYGNRTGDRRLVFYEMRSL